MTAELEVLVKALDAVIEARSGAEATRLQEIYQSRLGDVLSHHPAISPHKHALLFGAKKLLLALRRFITLRGLE